MLLSKTALSRRTLLRGLGTALALPSLDAMVPALARASAKTSPLRMAFVYVPNGIVMKHWTPEREGRDFALTGALEPFAPVREQILVLSGLTQKNGRALGDGPGDHARAAASYLTGFHPRKTEGADIHNGISVDQVAARAIGQGTRFPSLELGLEGGGLVGNCDSGYSCAYTNSIAWRSEQTPLPPELNPRAVFERLFGDGELHDRATRLKLAKQDRSLLDFVLQDASKLRRSLGATDQLKLDEYLGSVREIEHRIQVAEKQDIEHKNDKTADPTMPKPAGVPVTFEEYARLMFDLMTVAFQTDSTRIATFLVAREGSNRTYRSIGVPDAHHGISHHMGNQEKIDKLARINRLHAELFAGFLKRLQSLPDGDGTMLDHTMILYGSGLSDGNAHSHDDLPAMLAGGANGAFKLGRHVRYPAETPLNNLFLSMLDTAGVKAESLGDSSGRLPRLTDLTA
ncbi:DUF1552 domain-containing protein [uncultured Paludibaculum sp.]|uniref:DUF1552 domain-containing protein n=1 Tax=uncultured Paludibaculum sp. TaxID=1765020 RepID=UPI002AABE58D|nr:DUF1552 domain-containing protein [uncultured Paludibaculum sp.]